MEGVSAEILARYCGLSSTHIAPFARRGVMVLAGRGKFDLEASVRAYATNSAPGPCLFIFQIYLPKARQEASAPRTVLPASKNRIKSLSRKLNQKIEYFRDISGAAAPAHAFSLYRSFARGAYPDPICCP